MNILKPAFLYLFFGVVLLTACGAEQETKQSKKEELAALKETKITDSTIFENAIDAFGKQPGAVGVFDVPEMLVLSILDSASKEKLADLLIKNYALLEQDVKETGAEMNGHLGIISYTNNPANFVFEAVLCIKRMPVKQPAHAKVVVLEASKMLVFNFYGPYQNLFAAYDKIRKYCDKNDLIQSGPIREFYITDPGKEPDPEKWLTRLFLPVISMR